MAVKRITASADAVLPAGKRISSFYVTGTAASTMKLFDGTQAGGIQIGYIATPVNTTYQVGYDVTQLYFNPIGVTITGAGSEGYIIYE